MLRLPFFLCLRQAESEDKDLYALFVLVQLFNLFLFLSENIECHVFHFSYGRLLFQNHVWHRIDKSPLMWDELSASAPVCEMFAVVAQQVVCPEFCPYHRACSLHYLVRFVCRLLHLVSRHFVAFWESLIRCFLYICRLRVELVAACRAEMHHSSVAYIYAKVEVHSSKCFYYVARKKTELIHWKVVVHSCFFW